MTRHVVQPSTAVRPSDLTPSQRAVMVILRLAGRPLLDEELVSSYRGKRLSYGLGHQSESGIRSRRSELARAGALVEGERRRMTTGRMGRTWGVAPAGPENEEGPDSPKPGPSRSSPTEPPKR